MTASLILPWLRLRKVPVRSVVLSDHAVRLYFDYGKLNHFSTGQDLTFDISDSRLWYFHAAVGIPIERLARVCDNSRAEQEGLFPGCFPGGRLDC